MLKQIELWSVRTCPASPPATAGPPARPGQSARNRPLAAARLGPAALRIEMKKEERMRELWYNVQGLKILYYFVSLKKNRYHNLIIIYFLILCNNFFTINYIIKILWILLLFSFVGVICIFSKLLLLLLVLHLLMKESFCGSILNVYPGWLFHLFCSHNQGTNMHMDYWIYSMYSQP